MFKQPLSCASEKCTCAPVLTQPCLTPCALQSGPGVEEWRKVLIEDADKLEAEYDVMLYGNGGQMTEETPFTIAAASFMSPKFSTLLFLVSTLA